MTVEKMSINLGQLKKSILYDALDYNIREEKLKNQIKNKERQKQMEEYHIMYQRVIEEQNRQKQKQMSKKCLIRNLLSNEYDKQMQYKQKIIQDEKRQNQQFAVAALENQKSYYQNRARELAKIYRAHKTFQSVNPEYCYISQSKLRKYRTNPSNKLPRRESKSFQENSNLQPTKKESLLTEPTIKFPNYNYREYLKEQIDRKRQKSFEQTRKRIQAEQQIVKYNNKELLREEQQQKKIHRSQQLAYRSTLDKQIQEKKSFKNFYQ